MSGSVNKVILIGNLGRDPEIKSFPNGGKIANFSIATSETWRDKQSGEKKEHTEWHNIVIKNEGLVGVVERYVKKGSKLYIEGSLQTRKWTDPQGIEKFTTEIALQNFNSTLQILDSRDRQSSGDSSYSSGSSNGKSRNDVSVEENDDEIPF